MKTKKQIQKSLFDLSVKANKIMLDAADSREINMDQFDMIFKLSTQLENAIVAIGRRLK